MRTLDIIDRQLELGDVKVITTKGGSVVKFIELLFSPTTKAQFAPSNDNKTIRFCIKDVDLALPQLECNISKSTIRDLILGLTSVYNQINESERKENQNEFL